MAQLVCSFCRIALAPAAIVCPRDGQAGREVAWQPVPAGLASRFQVVEPFGHGHMGSYYLADEPETGRRGLLHILVPPKPGREAERARLRRELLKQATLTLKGVATPLSSGESNGVSWLFRPHVVGESMALLSRLGRALSPRDALAVAAQLTVSLDELHRGGLLHRDLSPSNVILQADLTPPRPVIIGVGLAPPLSHAGHNASGTAGYVAPEQISGKLVSFRSDLYSLGCVIYELLAGRPAFGADSPEEVVAQQQSGAEPPLPPGLPAAISELLGSLLSADPQKRPFSAKKVRRALDPYLPEGPPVTPRDSHHSPSEANRPPLSAPPPPPAKALRRSASSQRPPGSGTSIPPPPRAPSQAESTQQLDIRQIEEIRVTQEATPRVMPPPVPAGDQTQELSIEQLLSVSHSKKTEAVEAPKTRDDETVPVRLDQIMSVASSRRKSAKPPEPPPSAKPVPEPAPAAEVGPAAPAGEATVVDAPAAQQAGEPSPADGPGRADATIIDTPREDATLADVSQATPLMQERAAATPQGSPSELPPPAQALHDFKGNDASPSDQDASAEAAAPLFEPPAGAGAAPASTDATPSPHDSAAVTSVRAPAKAGEATARAVASGQDPSDTMVIPGLAARGGERQEGGRRRMAMAAAALLLGAVGVSAFWSGDDEAAAGAEDALPDASAHLASDERGGEATIPTAAAPLPEAPAPESDVAREDGELAAADPAEGADDEPAAELTDAGSAQEAEQQASADDLDPAEGEATDEAEATDEVAVADELEAPDEDAESSAAPAHAAARGSAQAAHGAQARSNRSRRAAQKAKRPVAKTNTQSDASQAAFRKAVSEARGHYAKKRYRKAARAYERAVRHVSTDAGTFAGLGAARLQAGNARGAVAAYRRAVSLAPRRAGFHAALGRAYLATGEKRAARAAYKKALALDPGNAAAKSGLKVLGR